MGGKSKIFSHPHKPDIDRAIGAREPDRRIATRFQLSEACVRRYRQKHFPTELAAAREIKRVANADAILQRLELELDSLGKIREAAEDYLRDPDNPQRFVLGPRGWDIDVVYLDKSDKDTPIERKANLQELIDILEDRHDGRFLHMNVKYKDPAMLLIDAIRSVKPPLELIARVLGVLKEDEGKGGNTIIINYLPCPKPGERDVTKS